MDLGVGEGEADMRNLTIVLRKDKEDIYPIHVCFLTHAVKPQNNTGQTVTLLCQICPPWTLPMLGTKNRKKRLDNDCASWKHAWKSFLHQSLPYKNIHLMTVRKSF